MRFAGAAAVFGSSAASLEDLLRASALGHGEDGSTYKAVDFGRRADELGPVRQTGSKAWWRSDLLPGVRESAALVSSSVGNGHEEVTSSYLFVSLLILFFFSFSLFDASASLKNKAAL